MTKQCIICSNDFKPTKKDYLACSSECGNRRRFKERYITNCDECNNQFTSKLPKISYAKAGRPLPRFCSKECFYKNKNNKVTIICLLCGKERKVSPSTVIYHPSKFCSLKCVGKYYSGERSSLYIDGNQTVKDKIRHSPEYFKWKLSVFYRDGKKCIWCSSKKNIEADHIKPQSLYPELRFDLDNGRTLCHDCHTKTASYMKRFTSREEYEAVIIA